MKKNYMMRLAAVLLVLVLLSTCVISGTFAKYVTTGTADDSARIAKWGFNNTKVIKFDMFDGEYDNVKSANGENVVAPGTTKTAIIKLTYENQAAPEVAYNFAVELNVAGTQALLDVLVWKYTYGTKTEDKLTYTQLVDKINALSADYAAGKLPEESISITWEWPFELSDSQDAIDTVLGNADSTELVVTFKFTATQKD